MGKRSPETEARDRTGARDAAPTPSAEATRSSGPQAGNNMEKDATYTWTPAQKRQRSPRRVAALV
jgi:hypothetical protein